MPTPAPRRRAPIPVPRPLSPRAAAFVRAVHAQEAARSNAIRKSVAAALAEVTKAETKQAKTPQRAVYDQNGVLVGVVDPEHITPTLSPAPVGKPVGGGKRPVAAEAATQEPALGGPTPPPRAGAPVQVVEDDAVAKIAALRKAALHAYDPAERIAAYNALNTATVTAITRMHAGR